MSLAQTDLRSAHSSLFAVAQKINTYLIGLEGTGVVLTFRDMADAVGVDLPSLSGMDSLLFIVAAEAAVEHRGWDSIREEGAPVLFRRSMAVTEYRKSSTSSDARRRAAQVSR